MDDVSEREDDVTRTDLPVTRPGSSGPSTDRVRIVGAEPAGEVTGELPLVPPATDPLDEAEVSHPPLDDALAVDQHDGDLAGPSSVHLTDRPADSERSGPAVDPVSPGQTAVPGATAAPTELPHWTEPPTGQVPAVLSRDAGDDTGSSGIVAPSWREGDADWVAHDEEFEPAMFGDDQVALGSLDETDRTDVERRPWEFDLGSTTPGAAGRAQSDAMPTDPITEETQPVGPASEAAAAARGASTPDERGHQQGSDPTMAVPRAMTAAGGAAVGMPSDRAGGVEGDRSDQAADEPEPDPSDPEAGGEELFADKARPTGTARLGRARRAGLLPARMRAKRPAEDDMLNDAPLAAEPPGASVADVPGAGRKRGGVAGLAAADRSAERDDELSRGEDRRAGRAATASAEVDVEAAAVATGTSRRRSLRRPAPPRPASTDDVGDDGPTGGGPPARPRRRPPPDSDRTGTGPHEGGSPAAIRVGTGLAVAVVALIAFKLGTVESLVLSAIVVTFAAGECFGVLRRVGYHPATLLGLVGTISLIVGAYAKGIAALPLVLVLITVFTLIWYLFGIERGSPVAGTAATLLTVGWVSLLGSYAGLLLSPSAFPHRHGIAFLLGAIIATVANDVGALVIGGWLGSRPLAPIISHNKTWEGLFGGAVFSILVSTVVVGNIHPWSASNAALLGVVVAVVAPIGDLCESLLKRDLRLKDMGTLLPGHGGVLDRVDALLFVLPATYYLVRALNIA